jgi:mannan endo-1,4-beta-mannosidase
MLLTRHDALCNRTLVERTNSISGRKYRDDATIFAWDLVNEPRCETWRVSRELTCSVSRVQAQDLSVYD